MGHLGERFYKSPETCARKVAGWRAAAPLNHRPASTPRRLAARRDVAPALGAPVDLAAAERRAELVKRLLAVRIACWAKPMRWFGSAHFWLEHVGRRAPADVLELVALKLCRPCFEISNFCFERTYALQQRRLLLLGGRDMAMQFDRLALKIKDGVVAPDLFANVNKRLQTLKHEIEALKAGTDINHRYHPREVDDLPVPQSTSRGAA